MLLRHTICDVTPCKLTLKSGEGCSAVQWERLVMRLYGLLQLSHRRKQWLATRWRIWKMRRAALSGTLAVAQRALDENLPTDFTVNLLPLLKAVDAVLRSGCDSARLRSSSLNLDTST